MSLPYIAYRRTCKNEFIEHIIPHLCRPFTFINCHTPAAHVVINFFTKKIGYAALQSYF